MSQSGDGIKQFADSEYPSDIEVIDAIDHICGDDFCESMSMEQDKITGDLKTAVAKLSLIFRMAHSHSHSHACYGNHEDWRKELREVVAHSKGKEK